MQATWYFLLALMLVTYAVLDGFDFGAGIVHLFVAKTDEERRHVLAAIGPVWDGNEVWLIASGGVLVFSFPRAYAAAFSGLYLPLMMVLWLLVLRGLSIEFRSKLEHPLWRAGMDAVFTFASSVMAIVLGVALGNVLRGVPLDDSGYFQSDLFTDFDPRGPHFGAIDLYTALVGLFAFVTLAAHGATFLVWKTTGEVRDRSARLARPLWIVAVVLAVFVTVATALTHADHLAHLGARPWLWPLPLVALAAAFFCRHALARGDEGHAFLASSAFVASLLVATAGTLFPTILRSTVAPDFTLDAYNASSPRATLALGLFVWVPAITLAVGYFGYLYRSFHGKVQRGDHHY
ncbi:Cytochrome d ubiquinol oxidase subunit II [Labilithrix luteola]|uniref:Cytochrome d ubiquinol oxidase subunit II n=1 Tax=Labilithrix luteola TaxID=1391654 RepID=A0A0K1QD97_9BACT|nr:cytochrome d ubiquinol oxidase subunit II [Labilithrix luteola]AKV03405.1 Cytochrome d ubiquinol oxidase subunit II [Labilithrix luteola]